MNIQELKEKLVNEVQLDVDNPDNILTFLQTFDINYWYYVDIGEIETSQEIYMECLKYVK